MRTPAHIEGHASGDRMSENEGHADSSVRIEIRTVPDADMPDGMNVVPVERDGQLILGVRQGHISDEARDQFNTLMNHVTTSGLLSQNWGGPHHPGPPHSPA